MCGADIKQTIKDLMSAGPHDHYLGELISMLVYLGSVNCTHTASFEEDDIDWEQIKRRAAKCIDEYIPWRERCEAVGT